MDMRLQHGFSLVEVLVTLLVLKVGLLGGLAAQTLALRQVNDATQRTHAVALSHALLSHVQANSALAELVSGQITSTTEIAPAPQCGPEQLCSAQQLAQGQLNQWWQTRSGLSKPVLCTEAQEAALLLEISWQQRSAAEPGFAECSPSVGRSGFTLQSRWR